MMSCRRVPKIVFGVKLNVVGRFDVWVDGIRARILLAPDGSAVSDWHCAVAERDSGGGSLFNGGDVVRSFRLEDVCCSSQYARPESVDCIPVFPALRSVCNHHSILRKAKVQKRRRKERKALEMCVLTRYGEQSKGCTHHGSIVYADGGPPLVRASNFRRIRMRKVKMQLHRVLCLRGGVLALTLLLL